MRKGQNPSGTSWVSFKKPALSNLHRFNDTPSEVCDFLDTNFTTLYILVDQRLRKKKYSRLHANWSSSPPKLGRNSCDWDESFYNSKFLMPDRRLFPLAILWFKDFEKFFKKFQNTEIKILVLIGPFNQSAALFAQ